MTPIVAALLREREHYQRRNLPDRAAAVTAVLATLGHTETAEADRPAPAPSPAAIPETTALAGPPETATPPRPQPRRSNR